MPGVDAGPMVMDGGSASCECPTLPAACTPPSTSAPTFSPNEGPFGEQLASVIACADTTLRIAIYQATWACLTDLVQARLDADADLVVEIVVDDDQCGVVGGTRACALSRLEGHPRVTVIDDSRSRLMHHKFVSADGSLVWVSSANWTTSSFCSDFNNSVVVDQTEIVAGYEAEFDRMFELRTFGPVAPPGAVTGGVYSLYFSPETPVDSPSLWFDELISTIESAGSSIDVMISAWTRTEVSDALVAAAARGVTVRAVVSDMYIDDAPAQALIAAGIPTRHDGVHNKVLVVDGRLVITGSPNWSQASWANNEASLWIDDPAMAGRFAAELDRIWATATVP